MKLVKLLSLLMACIVLLTGCSAASTVSDASTLPSEDGATEITIEVIDYSSTFYINAAQKFEEETGIKVNVINNYNQAQFIQEELSADIERIQAELMAGKGADIYANTYLDYNKLGKNNHICNLADWIAQDPYFSDDTYYMNIINSEIDDGKLYSIPSFMMFNALGTTIEAPELGEKNLNWEEFFELTSEIKRSGVLYGLTDYEIFRRRFRDRADIFIDEPHKKQNLNSPEMVELLEQCKRWSSDGLCIKLSSEDQSLVYKSAFFLEYGGGIELLTNIRFDSPYMEGEPYLYDIPNDSGNNDKANKIFTIDLICINAASPYKGTAWKFVKFLLSEEIQLTSIHTPINRKAAKIDIERTLTETIEYSKLNIDTDQAIRETQATLDAIDELPSIYQTDIEIIVFNKNAKRFFNNEISAEEAAKSMAAAVDLYFKEQ